MMAYNFEFADTARRPHFADAEGECAALLDRKLALPCVRSMHQGQPPLQPSARAGPLSATERASYGGAPHPGEGAAVRPGWPLRQRDSSAVWVLAHRPLGLIPPRDPKSG